MEPDNCHDKCHTSLPVTNPRHTHSPPIVSCHVSANSWTVQFCWFAWLCQLSLSGCHVTDNSWTIIRLLVSSTLSAVACHGQAVMSKAILGLFSSVGLLGFVTCHCQAVMSKAILGRKGSGLACPALSRVGCHCQAVMSKAILGLTGSGLVCPALSLVGCHCQAVM